MRCLCPTPFRASALSLLLALLAAPAYASPAQPARVSEVAPRAAPGSLDAVETSLRQAYQQLGEAFPSDDLVLDALVTSDVLSVRDHFFRIGERLQPGFDGFFIESQRGDVRELTLSPGEHFRGESYDPSAPLKEMVSVSLQGFFRGEPLYYEAFVFRYEEERGRCWLHVMDPVFPVVERFVSDEPLAELFPGCEGPRAIAQRMVAEVTSSHRLAQSIGPAVRPEKDDDDSNGPTVDRCPDFHKDGCIGTLVPAERDVNDDGVIDEDDQECQLLSTTVCTSLAGNAKWIYGGTWDSQILCNERWDGRGCEVGTVASGDAFVSVIEATGVDYGDCESIGAGKSGSHGAKELLGRREGGHISIQRGLYAFENRKESSMSELTLGGECAGVLGQAHHGSHADANGHIDYTAASQTVVGRFQKGASGHSEPYIHLCPSGPSGSKPPGPVQPEVKPVRHRVIEPRPF